MDTRAVAWNMMQADSMERREAEKAIGKKFGDMSRSERVLAADCIAAFYDTIKAKYGKENTNVD